MASLTFSCLSNGKALSDIFTFGVLSLNLLRREDAGNELSVEETRVNSEVEPNTKELFREWMDAMDERKVESAVVTVCIPVPAVALVFMVPWVLIVLIVFSDNILCLLIRIRFR